MFRNIKSFLLLLMSMVMLTAAPSFAGTSSSGSSVSIESIEMNSAVSTDGYSYNTYGNLENSENVVILQQGLGDDKDTYALFGKYLGAQGFYVISIDMQGAEESSIIQCVQNSKTKIDAVLQELGLENSNLYLMGASMGGMEVFYYAANGTYKDQVKGIATAISTPDFTSVLDSDLFYYTYVGSSSYTALSTSLVTSAHENTNPFNYLANANIPIYMLNRSEDPYMGTSGALKLKSANSSYVTVDILEGGHIASFDDMITLCDYLVSRKNADTVLYT